MVESLVTSPTTSRIKFQPSRVLVDQVSQSYPSTLFRTLFSSVPKREFALHNVTLAAEAEMVVLLGASSSGKSTLLKLISGKETPISGAVHIQSACRRSDTVAQPIVLDRKPPFDNSQTVQTLLEKILHDTHELGPALLNAVCDAVGLTAKELDKKQSQLSPSENYRYGLARASLQSVLPTVQGKTIAEVLDRGLPSPILLLDEWMDFEASYIVHRVEEAMMQMTQCGAIIFCATHKPNLFAKSHRAVTLCRGEILSKGMT